MYELPDFFTYVVDKDNHNFNYLRHVYSMQSSLLFFIISNSFAMILLIHSIISFETAISVHCPTSSSPLSEALIIITPSPTTNWLPETFSNKLHTWTLSHKMQPEKIARTALKESYQIACQSHNFFLPFSRADLFKLSWCVSAVH